MYSGTGNDPVLGPAFRLAQLRLRGAQGGIIRKHRSMVQLEWTPRRAIRAAVLSLLGFLSVLALLPVLGRLWGQAMGWILPRLGLPVELGWHRVGIATLFDIAVPYPMLDGPWPDTPHFLAVGIGTTALLALSFLLPPRFLPARYFLRFLAAIQTVSLGFFFFATPPFPYPLPGYLGGLLTVGMAVLALVPIALGFGFYIFDHSLGRQVLITVLIVGHLAILLPLQGLLHAWLIHHLSLVVQPTLFFVFGLLVEVLVFVALYGWAMSWPGSEIPAGGAPR
ncbi:MAG: hypothetical protein AAB075_11365 [Gemmatimonadota bacterium]